MAALGFALVWGGYTAILWGYCLLKGYDVNVLQLLSPTWPPGNNVVNTPTGGSIVGGQVGTAIAGAQKK